MSLGSRMNSALAALNLQFVRKTGLERLRLLEQEFQALLSEYQALKSRYERLSDRLHLPETALTSATHSAPQLPEGAAYLLISSNTRLTDLGQRYQTMNHPVMLASAWIDDLVQQDLDLYNFRDHSSYFSKRRAINTDLHYALCTYYLKSIDTLNLLDHLTEDSWFGGYTVQVSDRPISQEVVDALSEIYFLERHLNLSRRSNFNVLNLGAGYGQFAHRWVQAFPHLGKVFCTDAIATFSFLCEYYLKFRQVESAAVTVPFDELRGTLAQYPIQLAVNIRSFSELPIDAIAGWLDLVAEFQIPYLMLVPPPLDQGGTRLLSYEKDKSRIDYCSLLEKRGYQLIARDPKFLDSTVQANGISSTHHFLFQRG